MNILLADVNEKQNKFWIRGHFILQNANFFSFNLPKSLHGSRNFMF